MNKQELIEKIDNLQYSLSWNIPRINKEIVLDLIEQLDEPQKPVVPQFVVDWYEEYKDNLEYNIWDWMKYNLEPKKRENVIFSRWLGKTANNPVETLVKMKLYGYTVEKEPKYTVKFKATKQYLCNDDLGPHFDPSFRSNFTKSDLEKLDLGWVFDCEGMEVDKVGK